MRVSSLVGFRLVTGPLYGPRVYLNFPHDPYVSGLDRYWAEAEFDLIKPDTRAFIGSGRNTQLTQSLSSVLYNLLYLFTKIAIY